MRRAEAELGVEWLEPRAAETRPGLTRQLSFFCFDEAGFNTWNLLQAGGSWEGGPATWVTIALVLQYHDNDGHDKSYLFLSRRESATTA